MKKKAYNPAKGFDPTIVPVDSSLGAPMGRKSNGYAEPRVKCVRLFRAHVDREGYDKGGAYWGIGKPLFCATDSVYIAYTRANDRAEAAQLLKLTNAELTRPI
jgi:hypothetical protein